MDRRLKYYLAGPMSGLPQFNIPTFNSVAKELRERGYDILSPAELDNTHVVETSLASPDGATVDDVHPSGDTWGDFLSRDVKLIADKAKGIILLPGWKKSRGARLEVFVGLLCGHPLYEYIDGTTEPVVLDDKKAARLIVKEFIDHAAARHLSQTLVGVN